MLTMEQPLQMELLQDPIGKSLLAYGYGFIPFSLPHDLITRVMRGWNNFLKLPFEERMRWRVGDPKDWDDGFVPRERKGCETDPKFARPYNGKQYDEKDFFHYRPHLTALLDNAKASPDDPPIYANNVNWLEDMDTLWHLCVHAFSIVTNNLDEFSSKFDLTKRFTHPIARAKHAIRLLSYKDCLKPGQVLGTAHIDRNFGTIQVYESHPALVLELPVKGELPYVPKKNYSLVFTGGKAAQLTGGVLQGVKHKVVVPKNIVAKEGELRQSIVFFAHVYPDTPA